MFVTRDKSPVDVTQLANELSSAENGAIIYASSHGKQLSMESSLWQNGALTKALVEGLNGKSNANQDGKITTNELDEYLSERVKELTNGKQTPVTTKPKMIPNLPTCKRQFVLNPYPNKISDETKQLIDELLLEKISLAGIARVTKVSKKWGSTP